MSKPIIGITTGVRNPWTPQHQRQGRRIGCDADYVEAVVRAGGSPVLLARTADTGAADAMAGAVDALLLSGGGDIVSLLYGQQPHPATTYQDPVRDEMEFRLVREAMRRGLPILGICRGIQTLNVALGGDLIQHIRDTGQGAIQHFTHETAVTLAHTIDIEPGSLLAAVLGAGTAAVNSWHHQAVGNVAEGLRVSARAPDGVIEAIEAGDGRPVLAVQCHPENCSADYPQFQKLFDWLVEQTR